MHVLEADCRSKCKCIDKAACGRQQRAVKEQYDVNINAKQLSHILTAGNLED